MSAVEHTRPERQGSDSGLDTLFQQQKDVSLNVQGSSVSPEGRLDSIVACETAEGDTNKIFSAAPGRTNQTAPESSSTQPQSHIDYTVLYPSRRRNQERLPLHQTAGQEKNEPYEEHD